MTGFAFPLSPSAAWGFMIPESAEETLQPGRGSGILLPVQTHSSNVAVATADTLLLDDTDAVVTSVRGLRIGVRTADCVPVVVYAPDTGAVAAVHAGWKGTLAGIAGKAVDTLISMGADPRMMTARIGPCICGDCYEVDEVLASRFAEAGFGTCGVRPAAESSKPHLDLPAANRLTLAGKGVADIAWCGLCTMHSEPADASGRHFRLPSWRRVNGESKRIVTWIELK